MGTFVDEVCRARDVDQHLAGLFPVTQVRYIHAWVLTRERAR